MEFVMEILFGLISIAVFIWNIVIGFHNRSLKKRLLKYEYDQIDNEHRNLDVYDRVDRANKLFGSGKKGD
jgi:hypothetical protein